MTFEEFFKKKKINLITFSEIEGSLYAEFKTHYEAMGEKSFDHTKKYWFNKLRRLYPAPPEIRVEKVIIENQLAEQTITDTLTEVAKDRVSAKTGFTPRFKASAIKPNPLKPTTSEPELKEEATEQPIITAKVGFTPRFKAGVTATKPAEPASEHDLKPEDPDSEIPPPTPTVGFKPRFKPPQQ